MYFLNMNILTLKFPHDHCRKLLIHLLKAIHIFNKIITYVASNQSRNEFETVCTFLYIIGMTTSHNEQKIELRHFNIDNS